MDAVVGANLSATDGDSSYISVAYTGRMSVAQPHFDFMLFPFDRQAIRIVFPEDQFILTTCGEPTFFDEAELPKDHEGTSTLIDATSQWQLDSHRASKSERVEGEGCVLTIYIQRKWEGFFLKSLLPSWIIVLAGLAGLWLDPTAPPLVGGRTALLILAMLISVNTSGSGERYPYFMWTDALYLTQMGILIIGLTQTMWVHQLIREKHTKKATAIDKVCRALLPLIYVNCIAFLLTWANTANAGLSSLVLIFGGLALGPTSYMAFTWQYRKLTRERRAVMRQLRVHPADDEARTKLVHRAFDLFDEDNSGSLEKGETAEMLRAINPKLSKSQAHRRVEEAEKEHFDFEAFSELMSLDRERGSLAQAAMTDKERRMATKKEAKANSNASASQRLEMPEDTDGRCSAPGVHDGTGSGATSSTSGPGAADSSDLAV